MSETAAPPGRIFAWHATCATCKVFCRISRPDPTPPEAKCRTCGDSKIAWERCQPPIWAEERETAEDFVPTGSQPVQRLCGTCRWFTMDPVFPLGRLGHCAIPPEPLPVWVRPSVARQVYRTETCPMWENSL